MTTESTPTLEQQLTAITAERDVLTAIMEQAAPGFKLEDAMQHIYTNHENKLVFMPPATEPEPEPAGEPEPVAKGGDAKGAGEPTSGAPQPPTSAPVTAPSVFKMLGAQSSTPATLDPEKMTDDQLIEHFDAQRQAERTRLRSVA